ncbi:MAG TPA: amidohydrolase family protein [Gaiellaceae bacterium]|nr:amidohydrolase family protein [Gaiellaceae bacterium]
MLDVVDAHSHLFPAAWASRGRMPPDLFDVVALLERQEEAGIATTVVSDPHIWYGDLDPGAIEVAREYNDFAAELQRAHAGKLLALGTATPWRGPEHVEEARRALDELGLVGLALATSDGGRYLDSVPAAFWELVVDREAVVFLHPGGTTVGQELMDMYRLGEVCGRPLDTTVTLARLVLFGVLERYPTLRLLCAHAGGAICAIADRLDFGHELRDYAPLGPWGEVRLSEPPSAFVAKLHLDTVTYGPALLRLALERVGHERLVFGSDNPPVPFPLGRSLDHVERLGLPPDERSRVLGANARALFRSGVLLT